MSGRCATACQGRVPCDQGTSFGVFERHSAHSFHARGGGQFHRQFQFLVRQQVEFAQHFEGCLIPGMLVEQGDFDVVDVMHRHLVHR